MSLPSQPLIDRPGRAHMAKMLFAAMQRDVDGQRELLQARARGETKAVFWKNCDAYRSPEEERHRLKNDIQRTLIRIDLATEGIRVQIARSRVLLGLS